MTITIEDEAIDVDAPYYREDEIRHQLRRRLQLGHEIKANARVQVDGRRYGYKTRSGFSIHPPSHELGPFEIYTADIETAIRAAATLYERRDQTGHVDATGHVPVQGTRYAYRVTDGKTLYAKQRRSHGGRF